jgi:hypothetical protein
LIKRTTHPLYIKGTSEISKYEVVTEVIVDTFRNHKFSDNFNIDLYGKGLASDNIVKRLCDE